MDRRLNHLIKDTKEGLRSLFSRNVAQDQSKEVKNNLEVPLAAKRLPGTQLFLLAGVSGKGATICSCTSAVLTKTERGAALHLSAAGKSNLWSAGREKTHAPIRSDVSLIKEPTGLEVDSTSRCTKAAFLMDCGNYSLSERHQINSKPHPLCHCSHAPRATVHLATEKRIQTL